MARGKVLFIDDRPDDLGPLRAALQAAGFDTCACDNAFRSLEAIDRERPDVVLMDLAMPHLDGGKIISIIRQHRLFGATPIVLFSARPEAEVAAEARKVAANGYLLKTRGDSFVADFERLYGKLAPAPRG